jgi:hypothetical protein
MYTFYHRVKNYERREIDISDELIEASEEYS